MIYHEGKYLVSAEDILKTALDCAHRMGVGGWSREMVKDMLREYSVCMNEIAGNNNIPWNKLNDWHRSSEYLRSDECLNKIMQGVQEAIESIKHLTE